MDRLRATNRSELQKTKGRIDVLKAEVAAADVAAARCAREARSALVLGRRPVPRTPASSVDLSAATPGLDDDLSQASAPSPLAEAALAPPAPRASLDDAPPLRRASRPAIDMAARRNLLGAAFPPAPRAP